MRKLLVVVDYQNDFVSGTLANTSAKDIETNIVNKIEQCAEEGYEIIYTLDTHYEGSYNDEKEGRHLPIHCVEGTEGHNVYGAVSDMLKRHSTFGLEKPTFGSEDLFNYLLEEDFDEIQFIGVVTNICVMANVVLAATAQPNTEIVVDASCCASNDVDLHFSALEVMKSMLVKVLD